MIIGVPKEIKIEEHRVGLTPNSVLKLTQLGHELIIERNAGLDVGFTDEDYQKVGAMIVDSAAEVFARAEMIVKVKEPQASECEMLQPNQILFTYLHLAADPKQTAGLVKSGCIAIAYETVTDDKGQLPLLAPMSAIAGRLAVQAGAHFLTHPQGGCGLLLGGIPGVYPGRVAVIGGGVVGTHAMQMAIGKQAQVTLLDISEKRLAELKREFGDKLEVQLSTKKTLTDTIAAADLVVGAVLIPGKSAPKLVTREMIAKMRPGSVVVDVAIDQGGCFASSHATTHADPIYKIDGVTHYCVANMPGAVPRTATLALNNVTLPYVIKLAEQGAHQAMQTDKHLLAGLNVCHGEVTYEAVAKDLGYTYRPALDALEEFECC